MLLKFLTLKWNISRTIWRIEVGDGSLFCISHALSFELNFFRPEVPFKSLNFNKNYIYGKLSSLPFEWYLFVWFRGGPNFPIVFSNDVIVTS